MTTPHSAPPQLSPDGHWWWDGYQWVPAAPALPPAPAYGGGPVYSPYGGAPGFVQPAANDGKAVASLVLGLLWLGGLGSVLAVVLGHVSRRGSRQQGREPSGMALAGLVLGYLGVAGAVFAGVAAVQVQQAARHGADVRIDLRDAAVAEEVYMTNNDRYTRSIADLGSVGFTPSAGVLTRVVRVDSSSYCLSASELDGTSTWYFSSVGGGLSTTPCR